MIFDRPKMEEWDGWMDGNGWMDWRVMRDEMNEMNEKERER